MDAHPKTSKIVVCELSDGTKIEYPSARKAAKLLGVSSSTIFYFDMDKGESLEHYFRGLDGIDFIFLFLFPIFNTIALIGIIFYLLFNHIWDKIKHWEK